MPVDPGAASPTATSLRIRGAIAGSDTDLNWTIERLTPVLLQQARYRMRDRLQRVCDAEDVVAYAWQVSLPRLRELVARDGRYAPVLLRFLSTAVVLRVNELLRQQARRPAASAAPGQSADVAAPGPGVPTAIVRDERLRIVRDAIDELEPIDREVIVLRLVEQRPAREVGERLSIEANAVNVRLHRAVGRLRARLPDSVFDDLAAESASD